MSLTRRKLNDSPNHDPGTMLLISNQTLYQKIAKSTLWHPEHMEMDKFINENLAKGYIRPSKSPMASPFFFVAKKNGDLWPCQDYWQLNKGAIKNSYLLPLISDLVDQLKGAKYFTKLNVQWRYNNVRIKDGNQWKAAFKASQGLFESTVMFFRMCNSPAIFQAMMDNVFQDMKAKGWIIIYMDDIFIFTKELQQNIEYIKWTLQRLQDNNLYLKPEKCTFWMTKVEYLGLIIQENLISMDPVKLNGIKDWPTPTTVKQVRSFLGFGNYYWQFIHGYGNLTRPLNNLLQTPEWQDAFDTLKLRFTKSPVLLMPDSSKPFVLETDTSLFASGAVLWQQDSNGDWHPCAYLSKSFNDTEHNYEIWDRELLAVIRALTEWRHYLQGSLHTVTLLSNHQNLAYFCKPQWLNWQQARWSLLLTEYDLKLVHVLGTKIIQSDALSWWPDLCPENNQDNVDKTLLPGGLFISTFTLSEEEPADGTEWALLLDHLFLNTFDLDLHTWIVASTNRDHVVWYALTALQMNGTPPLKSALSDWRHEDSIVFYKDKCYVPNDIRLRWEIVKRYHNLPPHGPPWPPENPGTTTTRLLVAQDAHICEELCWRACCLSTGENKLTPNRLASDAYQRLHYGTTVTIFTIQYTFLSLFPSFSRA